MRRSQIINTSIRLFSIQGYTKTTLNEIAKEVNITKAAIYFYFKCKEDLFFEIFETTLRNYYDFLICVLDEISDEETIESTLYKIYYQNLNYYKNNINECRFLFKYLFLPDEELKEKLFNIRSKVEANFKKRIISLFKKINFSNNHTNNYSLIMSFNDRFVALSMLKIITNPEKYTDEIIQQEWDIFWNGIKNYC